MAVKNIENKGFVSIIIVQQQNYCVLKVYVNYITWDVARIIWIGFEKNETNNKCLIGMLPKDVVRYILNMLGPATDTTVSADNYTIYL